LGQLLGIQELDPCRKLTLLKPEGTRRVRKPKFWWLVSVEEDVKDMGVRNANVSRVEGNCGRT
jgi:hypothetical protein